MPIIQHLASLLEPLTAWSWLLGLLQGLVILPLVGAAKKLRQYSLRDSRWRMVQRVLLFASPVIVLSYGYGYPYFLKWHFDATSIYSSYPRQYSLAMWSYCAGIGLGLGWTIWRLNRNPGTRGTLR